MTEETMKELLERKDELSRLTRKLRLAEGQIVNLVKSLAYAESHNQQSRKASLLEQVGELKEDAIMCKKRIEVLERAE
jgi:hypothetical protein